jgi:hypothetical protein
MTGQFDLIVQYKGEEKIFAGYLLHKMHSYQIKVLINEMEIFYEPDEEGNFRIIVSQQSQNDFEKIDPSLLYLIQQKIEELLK